MFKILMKRKQDIFSDSIWRKIRCKITVKNTFQEMFSVWSGNPSEDLRDKAWNKVPLSTTQCFNSLLYIFFAISKKQKLLYTTLVKCSKKCLTTTHSCKLQAVICLMFLLVNVLVNQLNKSVQTVKILYCNT